MTQQNPKNLYNYLAKGKTAKSIKLHKLQDVLDMSGNDIPMEEHYTIFDVTKTDVDSHSLTICCNAKLENGQEIKTYLSFNEGRSFIIEFNLILA